MPFTATADGCVVRVVAGPWRVQGRQREFRTRRLSVIIEVGEAIKEDHWNPVTRAALAWQHRVNEIQRSPPPPSDRQRLAELLAGLRDREGISQAEIAEVLNGALTWLLEQAAVAPSGTVLRANVPLPAGVTPETACELSEWFDLWRSNPATEALDLLTALRPTRDNKRIVSAALARATDGLPPFPKGGPVSAAEVKEILRMAPGRARARPSAQPPTGDAVALPDGLVLPSRYPRLS